ncbi:type IV pilin protein [Aestuariirhabdus litorea]|uniref:Type IV pilin protein n=1 Tax=Aestuariirhabdus litorea TaxID=2528527 RepID=A0A3P3VMX0_9GAMM|nr:type IV pilin protein [Aestuariirhabdus litorea]RRJ83258.1 type IV pilin protein [Aestuariirhabdus litorea]RWW93417.1 prepilin-type N-terminal cleavage/methylation domain-containing protein [Endozoicomonadaceae bacterium GTF-13]
MNSIKPLGFTLIELIIVVAITAILAVIAIPAYQNTVYKGHRAEAKAALTEIASIQERIFTETRTYVNNAGRGRFNLDANFDTENGYYRITVANAGCTVNVAGAFVDYDGNGTDDSDDLFTCFTATATARGAQANDTACTSLSIDQNGTKTATGTDAANCW